MFIYAKTQPTATSISHAIANICQTDMPNRLSLYAIYLKYLTYLYRGCIHIYNQHVKSLALAIQLGALYTYLTYALNKYDCYIPNIPYIVNMLNGLIDPKVLYKCATTQPTATCTSHIVTKFVPDTNMPTKLGIYNIYAQYLMYISRGCMCIDVLHIKNEH